MMIYLLTAINSVTVSSWPHLDVFFLSNDQLPKDIFPLPRRVPSGSKAFHDRFDSEPRSAPTVTMSPGVL